MKKLIPFTILAVVIIGGIVVVTQHRANNAEINQPSHLAPKEVKGAKKVGAASIETNGVTSEVDSSKDSDNEGLHDKDDRKATEIYHSAEEALAAVKKGALDYDDLILEQFADVGDDCSWCPAFFSSVKELMMSPDTNQDQRSYYAELLAATGKVQNVSTLAEAIKTAPNAEMADVYAEALELTLGDDKVVSYLGDQLSTNNTTLQEAAVAALTNHGTRHAAELLYKNTTEKGDSDGYYSKGIGLGELIPDEDDPEALPYLQELAMKRDAYSHLAVKALLNAGLPGLRIVFDILTNSKNPEFDKAMLKDAVDHVNYDDATEKAVKDALKNSSNQPVIAEFAKNILDDFGNQGDKSTDQTAPDATP